MERARLTRWSLAAAILALVVAWPGTQPGYVVDVATGEIQKPDPIVRPSLLDPPADERAHQPFVACPDAVAAAADHPHARVPASAPPRPPAPPPARGAIAARAPPAA